MIKQVLNIIAAIGERSGEKIVLNVSNNMEKEQLKGFE
jgi:predicted dinucleotide-binding enzyme